MKIIISLNELENYWLNISDFKDSFDHTAQEFVNTLGSIVKSAKSIVAERIKKHESDY